MIYRCVFGGKGCFFHPCARSPFRQSAADTCAQLALELALQGDCGSLCAREMVESVAGAAACQSCLEQLLPSTCLQLAASACWHCIRPVLSATSLCQLVHGEDSAAVLTCVKNTSTVSGCKKCTCNLICYFIDPELCKACAEEPEAASLFLHSEQCPQGWTFAEGDNKCFKTMTTEKSWSEAAASCQLAEPKSDGSIYGVLESINQEGKKGNEGCWIGGIRREGSSQYVWAQDDSTVVTENWKDPEFPTAKSPSCMHQTGKDAYWRNFDCEEEMCYVCEIIPTTTTLQPTTTAPTPRNGLFHSSSYYLLDIYYYLLDIYLLCI